MSFVEHSIPGTSSIRDAIKSHNRSQHQASRQSGMPSSYTSGFAGPLDVESAFAHDEGEDDKFDGQPMIHDGQQASPERLAFHEHATCLQSQPVHRTFADDRSTHPASEQTPLLRHQNSTSTIRRRASNLVAKHRAPGKSTARQTLFNASALLLGIGMLSEPLAFSTSGWLMGTLLVVFYGWVTCYTAKFLGRVVISDTRVWSYADIGLKVFGPGFAAFISIIFCLEIFTLCVILVTLLSDSLCLVQPAFSPDAYKILSAFILIPLVFLPLSLLSYTSLMGILSTLGLILAILVDGLSVSHTPGSLSDPAPTKLGFDNWRDLGFSFGLFMAGFGAHAAMPSLAADMIDPSKFGDVMDWAFGFSTVFYTLIGAAGYLMFGDNVSDEITKNLLSIPEYNAGLNKIVMWMLVIASLTKIPLAARPVNITLEVVLGLTTHSPTQLDKHKSDQPCRMWRRSILNQTLFVIERSSFVIASVAISALFPNFSSLMAILGAFTTFLICVIGPLIAKLKIEGRNTLDIVLLFISVPMAIWGSAVAIMS